MYYSGNRYLNLEEMTVNAQYIFEFLTVKGWSKNAICGVLGNMETESTMNPTLWESFDIGNTARGYGLVQWTPSSEYFAWCLVNSLNFESMDSNLLKILNEVKFHEQWGNDSHGNPPPYSFYDFTQSKEDPYILAMNFLWYYERPYVYDQPIRGIQAVYWYEHLVGKIKKKKSKVFMYVKKRRLFV
jgi:hypothetical protein